ncbi:MULTISPECIES: bacteriocin [unclassified Nostoc]|uniref:bacteriocin n=1 Tax=unclassified Nostoc TaxID=2593658 RepID=UPI002AD2C1F1|nr:bacteriocin [Nostoc sp. DedQUE03]MDZ7971604.1 bacteriocin [Nostoc sp. DedQUE03]MDZ8043512.1 bacteriocin [Nostoc sp. DedQUE02]
MENKKQKESQELSAQELANISGGIAVGEPYPGGYPTDDKYKNLSEAIAKHFENTKFPEWKNKYDDSSS